MKKKILSFIKSSYTKSFILGIALAFIIGFGMNGVMAAVYEGPGGGTTTGPAIAFMGPSTGLISRIGSLTIGQSSTASWIDPDAPGRRGSCFTTSNSSLEKEPCLQVSGKGVFTKLTVLSLPSFFAGSLALSDTLSGDPLVGLPGGLIIEDVAGNNDSIMATSLEQKNANGDLAPADLTTQRGLCAQGHSGVLYPCEYTSNGPDPVCIDSAPEFSTLCSGDDLDLTVDTYVELVTSCSTPSGSEPKCEYECDANYEESNGFCIPIVTPVDGLCGPAHGEWYSTPPNLIDRCSAGTSSAVTTEIDAYTWTCSGSGGGDTPSCLANRTLLTNNCKTYTGSYSSQPATTSFSGCINGAIYSDTSDTSSSWRWKCTLGGNTNTCSADKEGDPPLSGTTYACGNDGEWHHVLQTCYPAVGPTQQDFLAAFGIQEVDPIEGPFTEVCFTSIPDNCTCYAPPNDYQCVL